MKRLSAILIGLTVGGTLFGQSVFDMPKLFPQHCRYLAQFLSASQKKQWLAAETAARSAVKLFPNDAIWHYNVACICARQANVDEAFQWLERAIRLGFTNIRQLEKDSDLSVLRTHAKFDELLTLAKDLQRDGVRNATLSLAFADQVCPGKEVTVTANNTQWEWDPDDGGYMKTLLTFSGEHNVQKPEYRGVCAEQLQQWLKEGSAAGNVGDLYVNRDEDRTQVAYERYPFLTPVIYSTEAQKATAHVGAANGLFASGIVANPITYPVVGTSVLSLSNTIFWRSVPRLITTEAQADQLSYRLASQNQMYIYDASPDYSPRFKEEHLIGNTTQYFTTAVASREDGAASHAVEALAEVLFAGLAALPPDTKTAMIRQQKVMPTFQMLLRRNLKNVDDYYSPLAHPTVFDAENINKASFVADAHTLKPSDLPIDFEIVARYEAMPRQFVDYFDAPNSERISDTPWSIKRVIRGKNKMRKLTVAASSVEPGVSYKWFVVNGDPEKIRIRSLTKDGALTTLEVDYHGVFEQDGMKKRHVDIACVALRNGKPASAPAFVSFRYLANEQRVYDEKGRIASIDYRMTDKNIEDPVLSAFKNWRDDYRYDNTGKWLGWQRTLFDGSTQQFDTLGRRVLEADADGVPRKVVEVSYLPRVNTRTDKTAAPAIELLQSDTTHILTL